MWAVRLQKQQDFNLSSYVNRTIKLPGRTGTLLSFCWINLFYSPVRKVRESSLFSSYLVRTCTTHFREDLGCLNPREQPGFPACGVPRDPHWGTGDPTGEQPDGECSWEWMCLWTLICSLRAATRSPVPSSISWALVAPHILMSLVQHNRWCKYPKIAVVLDGQGVSLLLILL